jgi:hypothetical protein
VVAMDQAFPGRGRATGIEMRGGRRLTRGAAYDESFTGAPVVVPRTCAGLTICARLAT